MNRLLLNQAFCILEEVVYDHTSKDYQDASTLRGKELKLQSLIQINVFLIIMGAWLWNLYNVLTIFLQAWDIYFKLTVWEI